MLKREGRGVVDNHLLGSRRVGGKEDELLSSFAPRREGLAVRPPR